MGTWPLFISHGHLEYPLRDGAQIPRGRVEERRPQKRAYRTGERGTGIQMSPREPHWSGRLASGGEVMSTMTFVVEFEDGKEPPVHANMEVFGGKVIAVAFRDALEEPEEDED